MDKDDRVVIIKDEGDGKILIKTAGTMSIEVKNRGIIWLCQHIHKIKEGDAIIDEWQESRLVPSTRRTEILRIMGTIEE